MPYSAIADLPDAVREALPPRAQKVFREAFNSAADAGLSEERAFASAWGAVRNAGWKKSPDGGKWVKKKAQPASADVHVDAPMNGKKPKRKPKHKPDDEDDDHMKSVALSIDVQKVDDDKNLVFGWLSVIEENGEAVVDLQGHVIDEATLEDAAYGMVLDGCDAGEMHERIGIGSGLVECMVFTKAKQEALGIDLGKVGLWVGFKVDDEAFAKVKSGELLAFSLGGRGILMDMEEAA